MASDPAEAGRYGNTFSGSIDSGHREIADGVFLIEECVVKPAYDDNPSDELLEWYVPGEELHATQNAYLVRGERSLLYDTLTPAGEAVVLGNLREVLDGEPLDYLVISHPEANHAGNTGVLLREYPDVQLVVAGYGVHHELFDVGDGAMLVRDGDEIDLGGGRRVAFHRPPFFDHAMTIYLGVPDVGTVCTADWFGFEHMGAHCLCFADEQTVAVETETDVADGQFNRFQGYAFTWFRYADPDKTDALVDRFAESVDPAVIAPAHGLPIRRDLGAHFEQMKRVIRDISESGADYHTHTHGQLLLNRGSPTVP